MQDTRKARLAAVIQEELSMIVPREIKDPRVPAVTFTSVEMSPDGSQATLMVAIFGGAEAAFEGKGVPPLSEKGAQLRMQDCIDGLTSATGYLRRHLAKILTVRHVPNLIFKADRGLENTMRVHDLLQQIASEPVVENDMTDVDKTSATKDSPKSSS
ncbi:MAG: ribosome-binding factor A [Methylotenera sp.]|nr:ribosome-binding factor A [Oligoflexia bacterium]